MDPYGRQRFQLSNVKRIGRRKSEDVGHRFKEKDVVEYRGDLAVEGLAKKKGRGSRAGAET